MKKEEDEAKQNKERSKYASKIKEGTKTVMHLAAERNLYGIAQVIFQLYPKQHNLKTEDGELAVQLAIEKNCDEIGELLVNSMLKER